MSRRADGGERDGVAVMAGQPLPSVSNFTAELSPHSGTLVRLSWRPPAVEADSRGSSALPLQYGVFWGTSMEQLYEGGVRQRTVETSSQVTGLSAYEDYLLLLAVVGPAGSGLPSPLGRVRTQFDIRAPLKNVTVAARRSS